MLISVSKVVNFFCIVEPSSSDKSCERCESLREKMAIKEEENIRRGKENLDLLQEIRALETKNINLEQENIDHLNNILELKKERVNLRKKILELQRS